jgi:TonB family protein
MAASATLAAQRWYGAFELKQSYRKHMLLGVTLAAALHLMVAAGVLVYRYAQSRVAAAVPVAVVLIDGDIVLKPPPSLVATKPQITVAEPTAAPTVLGIPAPVPDAEVSEEPLFPTRNDLARQTLPDLPSLPGGVDSFVYVIPTEEYFPPPDSFVPVQSFPSPVRCDPPVYPAAARLTGQEGSVVVTALVTRDGKVREAHVARPSGSNVGFDEAALAAAYSCVYRPGIQNGVPIAVWITYRVDFKLEN